MYVWIWRHLPGRALAKTAQALLLVAAVSALLLFVVFPWAEPRLPFDNVTISNGGPASTAPSATPSGTHNGVPSGTPATAASGTPTGAATGAPSLSGGQ